MQEGILTILVKQFGGYRLYLTTHIKWENIDVTNSPVRGLKTKKTGYGARKPLAIIERFDPERSEWDRRGVIYTIAMVAVVVILMLLISWLPRLVGGVVDPSRSGPAEHPLRQSDLPAR